MKNVAPAGPASVAANLPNVTELPRLSLRHLVRASDNKRKRKAAHCHVSLKFVGVTNDRAGAAKHVMANVLCDRVVHVTHIRTYHWKGYLPLNPAKYREVLRVPSGNALWGHPVWVTCDCEDFCVTGDTLLMTDTGLMYAKEVVKKSGVSPADMLVPDGQGGTAHVQKVFKKRKTAVQRIRTHCGYALGGVPEHRVIVMQRDGTIGWRQIKDIQEGDYVAIDRYPQTTHSGRLHRINALSGVDVSHCPRVRLTPTAVVGTLTCFVPPKVPETIGPTEARILGYLVSEGYVAKYDWSFTNSDVEVMEDFNRCMFESFGFSPSMYQEKEHPKTGIVSISVGGRYGKSFIKILENLGMQHNTRSAKKAVPKTILRSPPRIVKEFLRALFEGDGGVSKDNRQVYYASTSKRLIRECQTVLLMFGIYSTRSHRFHDVNGKRFKAWHLTLSGANAQRFVDDIGFVSSRKRGIGASFNEPTKPVPGLDVIPHVAEAICIRTAKRGKRLCVDGKKRVLTLSPKTLRCFDPTGGAVGKRISHNTLDKYVRAAPLDLVFPEFASGLRKILEREYFFDRVVKKTEVLRLSDVYDLVDLERQSYWSNGFVSHNTYRWEVLLQKMGCTSIIYSNGAYPHITQGRNTIGLCKHLLSMTPHVISATDVAGTPVAHKDHVINKTFRGRAPKALRDFLDQSAPTRGDT